MNLQLVGGLYGRANDIDLESGMAPVVKIHADDEHDAVGHFDTQLTTVGSKGGAGHRPTAEGGQAIGDAAKILERHRSKRWAGHSKSSAEEGGVRTNSVSCEPAPGNDSAGRG